MTLAVSALATLVTVVQLSTLQARALEAPATFTGSARVIDGDTLEIGATTIRLFGIDSPESAQRCTGRFGITWACGRSARRALMRLVEGQKVSCQGRSLDDYGRTLAVCSAAGREINADMVRQGLAWAFVRYTDAYAGIEREARRAKRGVFAVETAPPWEYRAERWNGARESAPADRARSCPIKGNISRSGERIYHLPWQRDYARVAINEVAGERWFCNEGEAERAGWRKASR